MGDLGEYWREAKAYRKAAPEHWQYRCGCGAKVPKHKLKCGGCGLENPKPEKRTKKRKAPPTPGSAT